MSFKRPFSDGRIRLKILGFYAQICMIDQTPGIITQESTFIRLVTSNGKLKRPSGDTHLLEVCAVSLSRGSPSGVQMFEHKNLTSSKLPPLHYLNCNLGSALNEADSAQTLLHLFPRPALRTTCTTTMTLTPFHKNWA